MCMDDVAGPGHGYVSVFDADGNFVNRVGTRWSAQPGIVEKEHGLFGVIKAGK